MYYTKGMRPVFLCREEELQKMNRRYDGDELECVVIYGRRRVGKTALINEFVKDKPTIYFPALKASAHDNLIALSNAIHEFRNPGIGEAPIYSSFDGAFSEITRIAAKKRVVFVIDELPYLVNADESIPSRLQHLLDREWAESNLYLILCGSSMSFMEGAVLGEKSPLFGRRTAQFKIEPLPYWDAARFNPELSPADNALIYGITGGVPHYIRKLNVRESIRDALLENFFDASAYLFEEPANLLRQELREPALYNSIITAIATGATRVHEIAAKAGIETPTCSKYLKSLSELGIVQKVEPVVDKSNKKKLYRIKDNFFRFWYRFVPANMAAISSGSFERLYDAAVESYLPAYMGLVFEEMCRQFLHRNAGNLPFAIGEIGEWWGTHPTAKKEAQLDIVALALKADNEPVGRHFVIGSCKYKATPVGIDELDLISDYASAFASASDELSYVLFSKSGFTSSLSGRRALEKVALVSLEDMYSESALAFG